MTNGRLMNIISQLMNIIYYDVDWEDDEIYTFEDYILMSTNIHPKEYDELVQCDIEGNYDDEYDYIDYDEDELEAEDELDRIFHKLRHMKEDIESDDMLDDEFMQMSDMFEEFEKQEYIEGRDW